MNYKPDYILSPAEILEGYLDGRGITEARLAKECQIPVETVSAIIHNGALITDDVADRLALVLGHDASFWKNLHKNYQRQLKNAADCEILS